MKRFRAQIRVGNRVTPVMIEAHNIRAAKDLLEAQYGKANVFGVVQVR